MVAWGNSKAVGMAFGNSKAVGGAWGNQKFAFQTVFEWSGACRKTGLIDSPRNSAAQLPTAWIVGGGAAYLATSGTFSFPRVFPDGRIQLFLNSRPNIGEQAPGPQLTDAAERSLRMEFIHATAGTVVVVGTGSDTTEPYLWTPSNSAQVIAWFNGVRSGDNVRVRFIL